MALARYATVLGFFHPGFLLKVPTLHGIRSSGAGTRAWLLSGYTVSSDFDKFHILLLATAGASMNFYAELVWRASNAWKPQRCYIIIPALHEPTVT